jgi:hypothetical protein
MSVKANGISASSCLNIGTNLLIGFRSQNKSSTGNGSIVGDGGHLPAEHVVVNDNDWVDMPTWESGGAGLPTGF